MDIWYEMLLLSLLLLVYCVQVESSGRPIIGVLSQPTGSSLRSYGSQYIAASYVKYVESGGARVVPIFYDSPPSKIRETFNYINGVLFPGGGSSLQHTTLYNSSKLLFDLAVEENKKGIHFPIFGHCMGFETLAIITSGNFSILSPVDAENISMPLDLEPDVKNSRWLSLADEYLLSLLSKKSVTMNNHRWAVTPKTFSSNSGLFDFWRVISTNVDREGKTFISTWEGKDFPFYGMQWHAEKPQWEWNRHEAIPHARDAVVSMSYFSGFTVDEARKNDHAYPSLKDEHAALIYNYSPLYSESIVDDFEQVYVFPQGND